MRKPLVSALVALAGVACNAQPELPEGLEQLDHLTVETLGPAGGTLSLDGGAALLVVPTGALASEVAIEGRAIDPSTQPDAEALISGVYEFVPTGIRFERMATVSLAVYREIPAGKLAQLSWLHASGWRAVADGHLSQGRVHGSTAHSARFAVRVVDPLVVNKCGNGFVDSGEACDDGVNDGSYGGCLSDCSLGPRCGDGAVQTGLEECDDGVNDGSYGGCNSDCTPAAYCGDSALDEAHEECDDGVNDGSYGGCNSDCTLAAYCGDSALDSPETCDNGVNRGSYGGCSPECQEGPFCGDGWAYIWVEACDDGVNDGSYGGCNADCTLAPHCGDGVLQSAQEECDDGNFVAGDGCSRCVADRLFILHDDNGRQLVFNWIDEIYGAGADCQPTLDGSPAGSSVPCSDGTVTYDLPEPFDWSAMRTATVVPTIAGAESPPEVTTTLSCSFSPPSSSPSPNTDEDCDGYWDNNTSYKTFLSYDDLQPCWSYSYASYYVIVSFGTTAEPRSCYDACLQATLDGSLTPTQISAFTYCGWNGGTGGHCALTRFSPYCGSTYSDNAVWYPVNLSGYF